MTTIPEEHFVTLEDGFVYFWASREGAVDSQQLRQIADELDKRNEKWAKQINEYFDKQNDASIPEKKP